MPWSVSAEWMVYMSSGLYWVRVAGLEAAGRRVRFRVFLVRCCEAWGQDRLLPDDAGFFLRLLWEAADGMRARRGPLSDALAAEGEIHTAWVDANAHRFVERVEQVAVRNLPGDNDRFRTLVAFYEDRGDALAAFHRGREGRRNGVSEHEDRLVQADYDVWVTDARWLEPLREGKEWGTAAFPGHAVDAEVGEVTGGGAWQAARAAAMAVGSGLLRRGAARRRAGDLDGAAAAYRRAADLGDAHTAVEALLSLGELHTEHEGEQAGFSEKQYRRARAALELCVRLQAAGQQDAARAAYLLVHQVGEPALLAEARQRAGMETPAERGCRLARKGDRAAAAEELRRAYEPHSVPVDFALALYAGDFGAAEAALERVGGDLEESHVGCVAADLAFLYAREGDGAAAESVVELLGRNEFALEAWHYALGNGSAHPLEAIVTIGRKLTPLLPPSDYEVEGTRPYVWAREAYWICVSELGGVEAADASVLNLGDLLHEIGHRAPARAAYVCVREFGGGWRSQVATVKLARLLDEIGNDDTARKDAYEAVAGDVRATREMLKAARHLEPLRSAANGMPGRLDPEPRVAAAITRLLDGTGTSHDLDLAEGELLRLRGTGRGTGGDPYAALLYAQWLAATGGERPARKLRLKINEQRGGLGDLNEALS